MAEQAEPRRRPEPQIVEVVNPDTGEKRRVLLTGNTVQGKDELLALAGNVDSGITGLQARRAKLEAGDAEETAKVVAQAKGHLDRLIARMQQDAAALRETAGKLQEPAT